jgi:hypothetical protein
MQYSLYLLFDNCLTPNALFAKSKPTLSQESKVPLERRLNATELLADLRARLLRDLAKSFDFFSGFLSGMVLPVRRLSETILSHQNKSR